MQHLPHCPLLFILFLYRLFFRLLMGIYSNILSRGHVLVVILAWCSSRFVWVWKILGYYSIPFVGFIGPPLRFVGDFCGCDKGDDACCNIAENPFLQAYTRVLSSLYQA